MWIGEGSTAPPTGSAGGERERLQKLLNRIQAKLRDAEQMQIKRETTALWLRELKDLEDDVEDALDDFEYEELGLLVEGGGIRGKAERSSLEPSNKVCNFSTSPGRIQQGLVCDVLADRVTDIWRRFHEMAEGWNALNICWDFDDGAAIHMEVNRQVRETSSFLMDPEVLGRDRVKEEIIEFLVGTPTETRLSVLALVGIGGLGKTTLAQFVYNDERVGDYFYHKFWVHVSYDFDAKRVIKQIIEHVPDLQLLLPQMGNLNALQMTLSNIVKDKRFLIVLDDVWFEDRIAHNLRSWETLCAPLSCGGKGSRILVTTRGMQQAGIRQPVKTIALDGLEFGDSWSLFRKHAFHDGNSEVHPNLEAIGRRIVRKLNGVPLAVVAIGSLLRFKSEESEWASVLASELWRLDGDVASILPALRLSYEHLPPHLKPCFASFSIFPQGFTFPKLVLIQFWMASGYIQSQGRKRMEDVGSDNLNSLLSRSLVQCVDDASYRVHDLLHELGRSILQDGHCVIETDKLHEISEEDQHKQHLLLLREGPDLGELETLQKFRKLRTMSFVFFQRAELQIPGSLFINMTCLRVLDLSLVNFENLPDSIGNLRHLRYLDLRRTPIKYLPETLCSLYMLQTLKLQGCDQLSMLPRGMNNLINLRYLEAKQELVSGISGIGKLVHLQEMEVFSISEGDGIMIEDLKDMDELRGKLQIQNLQRVGSKEEASQANLSNKKEICELALDWIDNGDVRRRNTEAEEAVLDALVPPPKTKKLSIRGYCGAIFPSWMRHHQYLSGLEFISLRQCQRLDALPPLMGWLSLLKTLVIICLPQLKELPSLPTTLVNLTLQDVGLYAVSGIERLTSLEVLVLREIPDVRELPPLPATLRMLKIESLGLGALPGFHQLQGRLTGEGADNGSPSLCKLKISHCQNLRSLGGVLRHHLPYLSVLSIKDCEELMHWPEEEGFQATLQALHDRLIIENCPKLTALPEESVISPSLKKLIVKACPHFPNRHFFSQLRNMKNLTGAGVVHVETRYQDLTTCSQEALQQMREMNNLKIEFIYHNGSDELPFISLEYDIQQFSEPRCLHLVPYPRLRVTLHTNTSNTCDQNDYSYSNTLSTCLLRHRRLCGSVVILFIKGMSMPFGGFLPPQEGREEAASFTLHMPSLRELAFLDCRDMDRLPVATLLCHLRQLKFLSIGNCPELMMSSVEAAMQYLPSLERLLIIGCPKLSPPILDAPNHVGDDIQMPMRVERRSSSSCHPASPSHSSPSPPLSLRGLVIDDVGLLTNRQFACNHLTSLRMLSLCLSSIKSFPAAKGDCWLRSLHSLDLIDCKNLEELPPDLGSLCPSLQALSIIDCPKLRCMPERGLPASLEVLAIDGSPGLQANDWSKVAHVRLILIDQAFVQGSCNDYEEMVAKEIIGPFYYQ